MPELRRVGVLALQGDFDAHRRALERAGAEAVPVRTARDLEGLDGLVLPGGESTTMLRLMKDEDLLEPLRRFGRQCPIFGTCAGAILLASEVLNPAQESLGLMDIAVERNAYGRQIDSQVVRLVPEEDFIRRTDAGEVEAVFIRAPAIRRLGPNAQVFLYYHGDPVLVLEGHHMAATFHPELSADPRIHRLFVQTISQGRQLS